MANNKPVKIDDAIFQSKMRKFAKKYKINETDFIREQGALYARDIAKAVPPMVGGNINLKKASIGTTADKEQGWRSLEQSLVQIVFITDDDAVRWAAKTFSGGQIWKGKKIIGAGVILTVPGLRRWHYRNMRSDGRTRPLKGMQRMWISIDTLSKYYENEKKNVGSAKAAMAKSMVGINPKQKVPAWIKKNMSRVKGNGRVLNSTRGAKALIRSRAPGLQHAYSKMNFIQRFRMKAMGLRMKSLIKANAKKSGFKVR